MSKKISGDVWPEEGTLQFNDMHKGHDGTLKGVFVRVAGEGWLPLQDNPMINSNLEGYQEGEAVSYYAEKIGGIKMITSIPNPLASVA